jgi:hypothetical protein
MDLKMAAAKNIPYCLIDINEKDELMLVKGK